VLTMSSSTSRTRVPSMSPASKIRSCAELWRSRLPASGRCQASCSPPHTLPGCQSWKPPTHGGQRTCHLAHDRHIVLLLWLDQTPLRVGLFLFRFLLLLLLLLLCWFVCDVLRCVCRTACVVPSAMCNCCCHPWRSVLAPRCDSAQLSSMLALKHARRCYVLHTKHTTPVMKVLFMRGKNIIISVDAEGNTIQHR